MKTYLTFLRLIMFYSVVVYAQHIPPAHDLTHSSSPACWDYATARAFGKFWSSSDCSANSINLAENQVPLGYFDRIAPFSYSGIQDGDIVEFLNGGHVAYIRSVGSRTDLTIKVDQVNNQGAPEKTDISLQTVINGAPPDVTGRGIPTGYYRKKPLWKARIQNSFTGGTIKVQSSVFSSPKDVYNLHWGTSVPVDAVMNGQSYGGFIQRFQRWEDDAGNTIATTQAAYMPITHAEGILKPFTAAFLNEYDVTFVNHFVGLPNSGIMKVNGNQYSLPAPAFPVLDTYTITAEAINGQVFNSISYTFSYWSDGDTTYLNRIQSFRPTDIVTYTAHFTGKPVRVQNLHQVGAVGEPIHLVWDIHPNSNCEYKIWRKIKPHDPVLIATRSHNTTAYLESKIFTATRKLLLIR